MMISAGLADPRMRIEIEVTRSAGATLQPASDGGMRAQRVPGPESAS
jgi:hypothetical protein